MLRYVTNGDDGPSPRPLPIDDAKLARAIDYTLRGYSPQRVAQIVGIHVSHARLLKAGTLRKGAGP